MIRAFLANREHTTGVPLDFIDIGKNGVRHYSILIDQNEGLKTAWLGMVDRISRSQKIKGTKWSRNIKKKS